MTATATGAAALPNAQVQVAMGRMFDQATDVVAVAAQEADPSNPSSFALYVTLYDRANSRSERVLVMATEDDLTPTSVLMADFTGDGYDDLAVSFSVVDGFTAIVTATDPKNWAAGFVVGPLYYTQPVQNASFADMAAADVEGDGQLEIVGALLSDTAGTGPALVVLSVDPKTLTITPEATTDVASGVQAIQVVSGDWDANPTDDEVVYVASPRPTTPLSTCSSMILAAPRRMRSCLTAWMSRGHRRTASWQRAGRWTG